MTAPTQIPFLLRAAGLRVTRPRVSVLRVLSEQPHADTESVIAAVRQDLGAVSHQAVYDVLRALTEVGLLRRIQPAGSVARYEARTTITTRCAVPVAPSRTSTAPSEALRACRL